MAEKWLFDIPTDVITKLGIEVPPGSNPNKLGAYTRREMHDIIRYMQLNEWVAPVFILGRSNTIAVINL